MHTIDFDEMVFWPGVGHVSLCSVVRKVGKLPPWQMISLYRAQGCEPTILDIVSSGDPIAQMTRANLRNQA